MKCEDCRRMRTVFRGLQTISWRKRIASGEKNAGIVRKDSGPRIRVVHSKRPASGGSYKKIGSFVDGMVKDRETIPEVLAKWYPDMDFINADVYYNDFNCMFYINARMRRRQDE